MKKIMLFVVLSALIGNAEAKFSPNTTCIYIEDSGYYRIDIILNNFDAYYGYFTVHDGILI